MGLQPARGGEDESPRFLSPGEYTPQWSSAATSQNDEVGSVDVPILPEYRYRAIRSEFNNGKAKAYIVELSQRLVVVKSKNNNAKAQYLLTLIPDKEFYAKNKGDILCKFLNSGDKSKFSGYTLYSRHGVPMLLNRYVKGKKIRGVSLIGVQDKDEYTKRLGIITTKLREMHIQQGKIAVQTRVGGEDDMWSCDCGNCATCSGGYVFCTCGNCDECGYICDSCGCNPCGCCDFCGTSPCICNNFFCPYCFSSFCDGNCQSSVCQNCNQSWCNGECMNQGCEGCGHCDECNPPCDCGHCYECTGYQCGNCGECIECRPDRFACPYSCGKIDCKGECKPTTTPCTCGNCEKCGYDNQQSQDNTPKNLSNLHGRIEYYKERLLDYAKRYGLDPNNLPRTYYKDYGEKYFTKFNDLKNELSDKGKEWVDKTGKALQEKLSDILERNPNIEDNMENLSKEAFESHAEAYLESGIIDLPMSDKVNIFFEVDKIDLDEPGGVKQIIDVGVEQIKHWGTNPSDMYDDAKYFKDNYGDIIDKAREWWNRDNPGTRSIQDGGIEALELLYGDQIRYLQENVPGFSLPHTF